MQANSIIEKDTCPDPPVLDIVLKEEPLSPPRRQLSSPEPQNFEESLELVNKLVGEASTASAKKRQMVIKPIKNRLLSSLTKLPANNNELPPSTDSKIQKQFRAPTASSPIPTKEPVFETDILKFISMPAEQRKSLKRKTNCK